MSQPNPVSDAHRHERSTSGSRRSVTTAEGIAGQQALLAAGSRGREISLVTHAARRLEQAARADAHAA